MSAVWDGQQEGEAVIACVVSPIDSTVLSIIIPP